MTIIESTFEAFVLDARPRLRRALLGAVGVDRVDDAVAEAIAVAYERWDDISAMENPVGYLFRVAQSKSRQPKRIRLFVDDTVRTPEVEPGLLGALLALPDTQRTAVWLAHGCAWTHREIADAMEVTPSTVATHVSRALHHLRHELGVTDADH